MTDTTPNACACGCGCGTTINVRSTWAPGHDKTATDEIIKRRWGSVKGFVEWDREQTEREESG